MANSQMISPAMCPVSSPSNKPARGEQTNGLSGYPKRDSSANSEVTICNVPDVGPDVEIDRGFLTKEYK
jgi:hypothetical protein